MYISGLKVRLIVAAILIIAFTVVSFIVLFQLIGDQRWHSEAVVKSGEQLTLSQMIALNSLELVGSSESERDHLRKEIRLGIEDMRSNQQELTDDDFTSGLSKSQQQKLEKIYFEKPDNLEKRQSIFLKEAETLLSASGNIDGDNDSLRAIINQSPAMVDSLNKVIELQQQFSDKGLSDLQKISIFLAGLIIVVTFVSGLFVYRPTVIRIEKETANLEKINRALKKLSAQDSLTRLANRKSFNQFIIREWRRSKRESLPLSLIMIDIDFFKNYNDSLGHQAGDKCLKSIARLMKKTFTRPGDFVARYGGEEFVVVLAATDLEGARKLADDLRAAVVALEIVHPDSAIAKVVTVSLGVATSSKETSSYTSLIRAADSQLYRAKEGGRNRVESKYVQKKG